MPHLPLPYKWEELSPEDTARIRAGYPVSDINDLVRYEHGVVMPRAFIPDAERLYNFPLRDDDIWIVTFPKTGTTWTQEMVWMLTNDVDKEKGALPLLVRSPFLEIGCLMGDKKDETSFMENDDSPPPLPESMKEMFSDPMEFAGMMTGRRVLKSHLPMEFLPPDLTKRCKVVYVCRNPKDTCVSYFHHSRDMPGSGFVGDFAQFAELFKDGLQLFGDYWQHLLSGWKLREEDNVKFLWFEDMKKDQRKIIEELCVFLEHPLSPALVDSLVDHLKFENMRENPGVNPTVGMQLKKGNFIRKGQVGDWKNFFTPEKTEEWAEWIREKTEGTGLEGNIPAF